MQLHEHTPVRNEIKKFLEIYDKLERFEATQRIVRGYGALPESEYPNAACATVIAWLRELAETTENENNDV